MLLIALAASARFSAPVPLNLRDWYKGEDVPGYLAAKGQGVWGVGIDLTVDPDGIIRACNITATSGISGLDALTCTLARSRAKFRPAYWLDGSAAYGTYRTTVFYSVDEGIPRDARFANPLMELYVNQLPGIKSPALARVMFAVDAAGKIVSCGEDPIENFEHADNEPTLVSIACEQISKAATPIPPRDDAGNPVPSIQDALIKFSVKRR